MKTNAGGAAQLILSSVALTAYMKAHFLPLTVPVHMSAVQAHQHFSYLHPLSAGTKTRQKKCRYLRHSDASSLPGLVSLRMEPLSPYQATTLVWATAAMESV